MSLELQSCLSCNCGPVSTVDKEIIAYMAANSVVLWNISSNRKDFIWHESLGITTCAASSRANLIAVGEEGANPCVAIYSWPYKSLVRKIHAGAAVMYTALAFNKTGDQLITVADYPDYTLKVWEGDQELVSLDLGREPLKIMAHYSILILLKHEVKILTIHNSYELPSGIEEDLFERNRYSLKTYSLAEIVPLDATWDKYGNIYLSTNAGELLVLKPNLKETLAIVRYDYNILSMVLTHRYLVIATSENKIQWLNIYIPKDENDPRLGKNLNLKPHKELPLEDPQDIIQLLYTGDMSKLVMIGAQGKIQVLHQPAEPGFEVEDEEEDKEEEDVEDEDEDEEAIRKPKLINATPQVLGQFHIGCVKSVVGLGDSTQCATIAEDFRIWEVVTGENLMQYSSPGDSEYTSIDANLAGNLVAIGSSLGVIRIFDVFSRMVPRLLIFHRLINAPITWVQFSPSQRLIACSSNKSNQIYFIEASINSLFRVIGFIELTSNIKTLTWYKKSIIALLENQLLVQFDEPRADTPSSLTPMEATFKYRHVADGLSIGINNNMVHLAGSSKDILIYQLPEQSLNDIDLRKLPPDPNEIYPVQQIQATVLSFSPDQRILAAGCADGLIQIGDLSTSDNDFRSVHGPSGVQCLSFSVDSSLLFSTGSERDFFVWSITGRVIDRPVASTMVEDPQIDALDNVDDKADAEIQFFSEILTEAKNKAEAKDVEKFKSKLKARVQELQDKLQAMLSVNEKCPELEKLGRDEFVLDLVGKQKIEEEGKKAAQVLREQAKKENLAQELLKERIKMKTIDSMEVNSRVISSMQRDQIVYNYTIRKLAISEQSLFKKIKCYRMIELREATMRKEKGLDEIIDYENFAVDWIIGKKPEDWKNHPLLQALDKKRTSGRKEGDPEQTNEWELLYPAPLIYTPARKRTQIYLLYMLCRALKEGFNVEFEKLIQFKEKQVDLIEEKNQLIQEKQKELNVAINVFSPPIHRLEDPNEMLKIKDSDFTVEKYLTKEEREALEEKRRKEEERLRLLNADDSKKKALNQMMYGTIENKKNNYSKLTDNLQREEWMDKLSLQEMTEEQRQKLKEFEEKDKKLQEEKDKLRKIIEGELKKLQGEVNEICKVFDQKVRELFLLRLDTDYEIYQMEFMIARLVRSIMADMKRKIELEELRKENGKLDEEVNKRKEEISEFGHHIEFLQAKIKRCQDDSKAVDAHFKTIVEKEQNINTHDQKKIKDLLKNGPERKQQQKVPLSPDVEDLLASLNALDPFTPIEKEKIISNLPLPQPKEIEDKDLVGIPEQIHEILKNNRKKKLNYEKQIPQLQKHIKEVEVHKKWLEKKYQKSLEKSSRVREELQKKEDENIKQRFNTELLLKMKQAVVEVPQQPVVTDYADAILIYRDVVESKNRRIREIGNEKVKVLQEIADFKIALAKVKWREELLELETEDFKESEGDLKMLRIDKRLQNILAGRGLDENQQMQERIRNQIEHLNINTEKRVKQIYEKKEMIVKSIMELTKDNEVLENEVSEMEKQEENREQLLKLRATISDQARDDPAGKFRQISDRRRMMDKIEQYREEIEFLNDELDRLRAKTFPSFAHLQAHVDFPDEY